MPDAVDRAATRSGLEVYRQQIANRTRLLPLAAPLPQLELAYVMVDLAVDPLRARPPFARQPAAPQLARDIVAEAGARIVLVGPAGCGKSLTLRSLAYGCAAVGGPELPLPESWLADPPLPLLIDAADWRSSLAPLQSLPALEASLARGGGLVLVDNLDDEASDPAWLAPLFDLLARYGASRFVVVARSRATAVALEAHGFSAYRLRPLELKQVDRLIGRWYEELARSTNTALDAALQNQAIKLQSALRADEGLRVLASSPLLLTIALLAANAGVRLPQARPLLYTQLVAALTGASLATGAPQHDKKLLNLALALLRRLAAGEAPVVTLDQLAALADLSPDDERLSDWLRGGLLSQDERKCYSIAPLPLLHYLAAQALLDMPDRAVRVAGLADSPTWHEPLCLAVNMLAQGGSYEELQRLFGLLLDPSLADSASRQRNLVLAAELLLEIAEPHPFESLVASLRERLPGLLAEAALPLPERVRAGLLLGRLGDPRTASLLPDTVLIPAGPFLFGEDHGNYDDEGPASWVALEAFAIGRHPVTNREYARFLQDLPQHAQPHYWNDPAHNNPSQPVVGVTLADAQAYCNWLTGKLQREGLLGAGQTVRLPHEVEWEKAAAGDPTQGVKDPYPWGREWHSSRCNTADDRGDWTTTPIGCYPTGVSCYGVHDMIGNVWEWTADEYSSYPGAARPFYEPGTYVLRGSSYQSLPSNARCTYRSRLPAHYWRSHLGFRIVIAAS